MKKPIILRKRYIPDEVIDISGDELVFRSEDLLITKWNPIRNGRIFPEVFRYLFEGRLQGQQVFRSVRRV